MFLQNSTYFKENEAIQHAVENAKEGSLIVVWRCVPMHLIW